MFDDVLAESSSPESYATLPALVRAAAARNPNQTALTFAGGSWTYRELLARCRGIVSHLGARQVRRGDLVALSAVRGPELVAAVLGVLEAGAAFVILDRAYPVPGLSECVFVARPKAFLDFGFSILDTRAPRLEGSMDDLAYVAFTSGTTGRPKGIVGTQRPVISFVTWYRERFGMGAKDRFALLSSLAHDPLLRDLFTPLVLGAQLAIPSPELHAEPEALRAWLADEKVTVLHLTPSMADSLFRDAAPGSLPAVRLVLLGGEPLTWAQAARCRTAAPRAVIANVYGTTETPQVMSLFIVDKGRTDAGRVPIGAGRDGVDLLVLDPQGEPCGAGELGEIAVCTPDLTLGYLNDTALTADRFRPAATDPTARVYHTGDLGRSRADGAVEIEGRIDAQLKFRGHRIEPSEIEALLSSRPDVHEAAISVVGADGACRLVAWIVIHPKSTMENPESTLRPWLLLRLPEPMVPREYVVVKALPRTSSGKLDRQALRTLEPLSPAGC